MTSKFARFVHEYRPGRYVVAQWLERAAQYHAPMTREGKRLTGCSTVSARSLDGLAGSPNIYLYRTRAGALARARIEYGDEVALNSPA